MKSGEGKGSVRELLRIDDLKKRFRQMITKDSSGVGQSINQCSFALNTRLNVGCDKIVMDENASPRFLI